MTRWHHASCTSPDVVLDGNNWPICKACSQICPTVEEFIQKQKMQDFSVLNLPADETPGQLNLWWPLTVPYETTDGRRPTRPSQSEISRVRDPSDMVSPIYGDTLKNDEFRLACLAAVDDNDHPVHLTLEVYTHDSRPEYEAASYQWGGEDGDYSLTHPVFIGIFWDVLLQTKNCWSMLWLARPWRGSRMVWVDAVCISQQNLVEREAQVAKMGQIYEECSRVMVYLGHDIVTTSTPFASYRPLHEFNNHPPRFPENHPFHKENITFDKLLQRKYFTRVWMIQELVYAERAVIRVGDVDYRADGHIMSHSNLNATTVPWFGNLGGGRRALADISRISDLLRLASHSHASDSRDILFGVIELVANQASLSKITPDYSISYLHFCIGIAAHMLFTEGDFGIILRARTMLDDTSVPNSSDPSLLSWLPCFGGATPFTAILDPSNLPYQTFSPEPKEEARSAQLQVLKAAGQFLAEQNNGVEKVIIYHTQEVPSWGRGLTRLRVDGPRPWYADARISSSTGALTISLTHLFTFESKPFFIGEHSECAFTFAIPSSKQAAHGRSQFHLTSRKRLDKMVVVGRDHLFFLTPQDGRPLVYLILREEDSTSAQSKSFRLLASDVYLFEAKTNADRPYDGKRREAQTSLRLVDILQESVADCVEKVLHTKDLMIMSNAYDEGFGIRQLPRIQAIGLMSKHFLDPGWQRLFPGTLNDEGLRSVFITLTKAVCSSTGPEVSATSSPSTENDDIVSRVSETYLEINRTHQATLKQEFVEMRFTNEEWSKYVHDYYIFFDLDDLLPGSDCWEFASRFRRFLRRLITSYLIFDWEWQYEGAPRWQKAAYRNLEETIALLYKKEGREPYYEAGLATRPKHFKDVQLDKLFERNSPYYFDQPDREGRSVLVRLPITSVAEFIINELRDVPPILAKISQAYSPPLELDAVLDLINQGATEEQRNIGVTKWLGGIKIDGSTYPVEIL